MSAGMIWYKTQPNSAIAATLSKLFFGFCGSLKSHDTTVRPQKIAPLISEILARSDTVIIIGGQEAVRPEDNIVFILSCALGITLEEKIRSRSHYYYDTVRGIKLPSLKGAVLFPSRFGGPEGIMLSAGKQTIIVLPAEQRSAIAIANAMYKFFSPGISSRISARNSVAMQSDTARDYEKFKRNNRMQHIVTRTYSEKELHKAMENAVYEMQYRDRGFVDSIADIDNRRNSGEGYLSDYDDEYYRKRSKIKKIKNIISLILVIGVIFSLIIAGNYLGIPNGIGVTIS